MAIPEQDLRRIEEWCLKQSPEEARDTMRVTCTPSRLHVTLSLWHLWPGSTAAPKPIWTEETFARLRYTARHREWSIYWMDGNLRWQYYDLFTPSPDITAALSCIDRDEIFVFWG